jgi:hypothetical protein
MQTPGRPNLKTPQVAAALRDFNPPMSGRGHLLPCPHFVGVLSENAKARRGALDGDPVITWNFFVMRSASSMKNVD